MAKSMRKSKKLRNWSVYMARCADGTLYTGISNDVKRRIKMHNDGKGAKYIIPARRPVEVVYVEEGYTLPKAMKREIRIKKAGKAAKEELVRGRRKKRE